MTRSLGNKNYSKEELSLLLAISDELLPIWPAEWSNVRAQYSARKELRWGTRTTASLRRKFSFLSSLTTSSAFPSLQDMARRIKARIDKRYGRLVNQARARDSQGQQTSTTSSQDGQNSRQDDSCRRPTLPLPGHVALEGSTEPTSAAVADESAGDAGAEEACVHEPTADETLTADDGHDVRGQLPASRAEHHSVRLSADATDPISRGLRPSLMELYHQIIELAVKAQLDADRRELELELREREERKGALHRQQKMMSMIAVLIKSKQM